MVTSIARAPRLSDEVAARLGDAIRAGVFAAGQRLPSEKELSERFAVSRMVIREAMSRLKSEELVETRQGLGAFVKTDPGKALYRLGEPALSPAGLRHIFQLRVAVEGAAASLAAVHADAQAIAAIAQAIADLRADLEAGQDGAEADRRFHQAVAAASKNPYLESFLAFLGANLREVIALARANTRERHPDHIAAVQLEHEAVLEAVAAHAPQRAESAMRAHLSRAQERLGLGQRHRISDRESVP
ncbi:MAG: FadR/GntR family transcriptional regulator [Pseudomonadota bacterium]